jgi:hypothetical protein
VRRIHIDPEFFLKIRPGLAGCAIYESTAAFLPDIASGARINSAPAIHSQWPMSG